MTGGPFAQATGLDNIPLDNLGGTADLGADATDNSADVNVNGANDVAANAAAEAQEIGAVPDPQSPRGRRPSWRSSRSTTARALAPSKGPRPPSRPTARTPPMAAAATKTMTTITAAATRAAWAAEPA